MKLTIAFLVVLASYMAVGGQACCCCPEYWTGFHGSCYRLFLAKKTWQQAENHCVQLGGHLTSVLSEAENTFLYNYWRNTVSTPAQGFWIGYNDIRTEGRWVWSDNSFRALRIPIGAKVSRTTIKGAKTAAKYGTPGLARILPETGMMADVEFAKTTSAN
ncbi:alpha-N-acetylgalactosamine-specific lectin-like [Diadema setosum]|uniref:alpha-N-acetylgalactosamine-specific lectin-like n=1 Tax=Diadema setosum TaxID=31175 RepID=UPI003B3B535D